MTYTLGNCAGQKQNYIYDNTRLRLCSLHWQVLYIKFKLCVKRVAQHLGLFSEERKLQLTIQSLLKVRNKKGRKERMKYVQGEL